MTQKINGHVAGAEFVGGNVQFFTVTVTVSGDASAFTLASLVPTKASDGSTTYSVDVNKTLFDVAVEAIQTVETPVILGALSGGNLVFRFATNRVAGTTEGGSTDPKAPSFAAVIDSALTAALNGQGGAVIDAGELTVAVVKADTL